MGVRLDWQIEAERAYQRAEEDPEARRKRRGKRLRVLLFVGVVAAFICTIGVAVWLRLYTVDNKLRQDLINTVQAETAALRIGDYGSFLSIQRTAPGGTWYDEQGARFKRYQDLKTSGDLKLTGNVIDATVDGPRGRVLVEELLDGVPYRSVWFYWRYGDGWRHVPSDYTFWGDEETINGKVSTLKFNQLDADMAQALAPLLDRWWLDGCGYLGCRDQQKFSAEIIADPIGQVRWDDAQPNTLIIPSPLAAADRVRTDVPLPDSVEDAIALKVADRLFDVATGNLRPIQTADAAWLRQVTLEWLAANFTGRGDPDSLSFIQSLRDHYGPPALVAVVQALSPSADISVLGTALKQPLETLALDWRTFFQRRLDIEKVLLERNDFATFQGLWDTNSQALDQMRLRMAHPSRSTPQVQAVAISPGPDGVSRANVQVTQDGKPALVVFRLVNGAWKRLS